MQVIKRYNQHRRDLDIDMKCENCGALLTYEGAYDDRYFWDKVVPDKKCTECGKSTFDLGLEPEPMGTRYDESEQV